VELQKVRRRNLMAPLKPNSIHAARNARLRSWRRRRKANEVKPNVLVSPQVVTALLAARRLTAHQARDGRKIAEACSAILMEWAENQRLREYA
jgi:hypothetical protein